MRKEKLNDVDSKRGSRFLKINFEGDNLSVEFVHPSNTKELPSQFASLYQDSEVIPARTSFIVERGKPLYIGLVILHEQNPSVLPKLIDGLSEYRASHKLSKRQSLLLFSVITGLKNIVEGNIES